MKKTLYTLLLSVICLVSLQGQADFLDPQYDVQTTFDQLYGTNISILAGVDNAFPQDLNMDIYEPVGDAGSDRPVILIAHTGSFLPAVVNNTPTGTRRDSTSVECARRLAALGYVACIYDYRKGWNPVALDEDIRKGSLMQAAYRGIQDTRTAVRYMRKLAAEEGNPYGINPDKIGVWGIGTGGYLALGSASLDDFSEVTLEKFTTTNGDPLIVESILGNIDGTVEATLSRPNHVGYDSDLQFCFNAGGALGDSSWIDGNESEPAFAGVHCPHDIFGPYFLGTVIVPTTQGEVVEVTGTRGAVEIANNKGSNDVINGLGSGDDILSDLIEDQKGRTALVQAAGPDQLQVVFGTDNFYGFDIPLVVDGMPNPEGSPWDWWSFEDLQNLVAATNAQTGGEYDAVEINTNALATNRNMSAEKARRYIDTIFMLTVPRMYLAMDLGDAITSAENIVAPEVIGLSVFPNPATDIVRVATEDLLIEHISVFNSKGLLIQNISDVAATSYAWQPDPGLNRGLYMLQVKTSGGTATHKVILH